MRGERCTIHKVLAKFPRLINYDKLVEGELASCRVEDNETTHI
jgi:hypothetical protein